MSLFWCLFLTFYCFGLFGIWLWVLIDDADCLKDIFNKSRYDSLDTNDWIKACWIIFLWPVTAVILYFYKGFIPTLKFIYKFFVFVFRFITYPFKLLFNVIKSKENPNREPLSDKIGKFIVKVFKL